MYLATREMSRFKLFIHFVLVLLSLFLSRRGAYLEKFSFYRKMSGIQITINVRRARTEVRKKLRSSLHSLRALIITEYLTFSG